MTAQNELDAEAAEFYYLSTINRADGKLNRNNRVVVVSDELSKNL